jgi:TP901 family phage tail tape measure protein
MATSRNAVIGLLRVLLSANTAEFETAMKRSADSAKAWSRDLRQIGQQATQVGAALTRTLTLPIAGVGIAAAKLAIDFESSFAGVRKTVDGTEPQLAELAQGFRNLSKTIPVNVNDLNRLGEAAGALGIPRDKIIDFASVMAKLGVSTNLTADQAADAIARIQNIFGAAGKDTERLASTLVALGNAGASTEREIVEMGQRIAGAGHTVGLTQAQVLAFASTLASVGINAEAGGSAISRVFLKINDAVQKGGAGLAEFARVAGMSSAQFKTAFETNAAGATQAFIEGLGRLKAQGENINATIEGLTGKNIILKDTLFRLAGAGQLLGDQLKIADDAWRSNTALSKEAGERFKTTESRLLLLGNRVKDVGITLGNALGPAIDLAIRGLNTLIPVLEKMAGMFASLPAGVQLGVVALAGLVAAAGPVIYVFGQLTMAASALAGAFTAKGIATRALAGSFTSLGPLLATTAGQFTAVGRAAASSAVLVGGFTAAMTGIVVGAALVKIIELFEQLRGYMKDAEGWRRDAEGVANTFKNTLAEASKIAGREVTTLAEAHKILNQRILELRGHSPEVSKRMMEQGIVIASLVDPTKRATVQTDHLKNAQKELASANATYAKELTGIKDALIFQIRHMGETGKSVKDLADEYKISELTVTRLKESLKETAKASDTVTMSVKEQDEALQPLLATWRNLGKVSAAGRGLTPLDPSTLYAPNNPFGDPRNDDITFDKNDALDPSKIDMGAWARGIPDSQRRSFWGNLFGSPALMGQQLAGTIVGAFQGGGSAVQSAVGQIGSSVAGRIGESLTKEGGPLFNKALGSVFAGALPVVGSLIGPLVGKLWGALFGTEGRDTKLQMAQQIFGSVEEMQRQMVATLGEEYHRLWKQFSEVGQNNKGQAVAAVEAIVAALDRQKKKQEEIADAAKKSAEAQQEALDAISAKYKTKIDELEQEYKSLSDSVAKEAKEEFMGLTEMRERERMQQIDGEIAAQKAMRDAEIAAKKETFAETLQAGEDLDTKLRDMFERGYKIPLRFNFPDGIPGAISPSALSAGYEGGMTNGWESRVPASALAGGGGGTAILNLDGETIAEAVVPHISGVRKRYGLRD